MKYGVVYNPASGSSLPRDELDRLCTAAGLKVVGYIDVTQDLATQLASYKDTPDIAIAAYGGDGTLSTVAAHLAGTNTPFAPLPGGTLNHFTKDLGIPQDLHEALRRLSSPKTKYIDAASVNDQLFLNNSSIGLYPAMLRLRDDMQKGAISKWAAAVISSIKAFIRYRHYEVSVDGETFKTPFVFVGNNDYRLEENIIGEREQLDAGILSVYAVASASRWSLLAIVLGTLVGFRPSAKELRTWKTTAITITVKKSSVRVSRDGEHERMSTPLVYKVHPKALVILC